MRRRPCFPVPVVPVFIALVAALLLTVVPGGGSSAAAAADATKVAPSPTPPAVAVDGGSNVRLETAALAAAQEANRIARAQLTAQVEASRQQFAVAVAALVFSGVAGVAAVVAALFAGKAWRENRRSADAAERMLTGYERPFLLLEVVESGVTFEGGSIRFDVTKYRFKNLGRVPALLTRRHFELQSAAGLPHPIDPEKEDGQLVVHGIAVAAGGESPVWETGLALPLISALRPRAPPRKDQDGDRTSVFFHGFVEYRDLAGRAWVTGFCFEHSDHEAGFQPVGLWSSDGPDPFNYDRRLGR